MMRQKAPGSGCAFPSQATDFLISIHAGGLLRRGETVRPNPLYDQRYLALPRPRQSRAFKSYHRLVIVPSQPN
jgi:hypothetical protein